MTIGIIFLSLAEELKLSKLANSTRGTDWHITLSYVYEFVNQN